MESMHHNNNEGTVGGTIGGTLLVLLLHINGEDAIKTCILAAIGAVVSYLVSLGMKWLVQNIRNYYKLRRE